MRPAYPPYRFSPVNVQQAVADTPVLHDGSEAEQLLSGEMLCSLQALTPLFPGNYRYPVKHAKQSLKSWRGAELKPDKQVAEPLRLPDGRLMIAGTSIKGMLRHSLAVLFSAPMERVTEHHYTYRPNFGHVDTKKGDVPRLECRPAIVTAVAGDHVEVAVLPRPRCAVFVRGGAAKKLPRVKPGGPIKGKFAGLKLQRGRLSADPTSSETLDHVLYRYKGGIDGAGLLANAFNGSRVHKEALIHINDVGKGVSKKIPPGVLEQYDKTQQVLRNAEVGHISASHPLSRKFNAGQVKTAIEGASAFEPDQLIYVEVALDNKGNVDGIRSVGHHYQYRWAYTSSVRNMLGKPRRELAPLPGELSGEHPQALSGLRLLFGYVRDDKTTPIGNGSFKRLAGRIAINHAVSEGMPESLDGMNGEGIPLRPLGEPRASAVEFYLKPEPGKPLATYGDLPDDDGGELAGRKFYPHQPATGLSDIQAERDDEVRSEHGTLARWICVTGTRFKFAIRFARLRRWELGALLAALEPRRLAPAGDTERYAHKLGLGRPLGMGSVAVQIDRLNVRSETATALGPPDGALESVAIEELSQKLVSAGAGDDHVASWLEMHAFVDRGRLDYPRGGDENEIFGWHTELRREYSRLRRTADADWTPLHQELGGVGVLPPRKTAGRS
jgi:hypothetical protein